MGKHYSLAGTATVGPKGQVVIPVDVREKMGITSGDKLVVLYMDEKKAVGFITERQAEEFINKMGSHLESMREIITKKTSKK
jgi:AbrB family looped-hinge helix DNA binding protein